MTIIYPFPVLHSETLDYDNPNAYSVVLHRSTDGDVVVGHTLAKNTLVGHLVQNGIAEFFCTVSVRGTLFRCTKLAPRRTGDTGSSQLGAQQSISIPHFDWSPEVFACAGVVLLTEYTLDASDAPTDVRSGLSEFFSDGTIHFPQHSKIAFSGWKRFYSMSALFQITSDSSIAEGYFRTVAIPESPLRISISMHPRLYDEVETRPDGSLRSHVLCTALTQVLQQLHQIWQTQDEQGELPLDEGQTRFLDFAEGLKTYLESKKIPTWEEDDFNPSYSASRCYGALLARDEEELED